MATGSETPTHPTRVCVDALAGALDTYADSGVDADWLGCDDRAALLADLTRVENRVAAFKAQVLAGADGLAERDGFKDPGAWYAATHHTPVTAARASYRLGVRLRHHDAVRSAYESGDIGTDHAEAVVASVRELKASGEVPVDLLTDVETRLVRYCREFVPVEVRRLGRHAVEVIDPDGGNAILEKLLAADENRAHARTWLSLRDRGDGTTRITGTVPSLSAAVLTSALDAYTSPSRTHLDDADGGVHQPLAETGDPEYDRLSYAQKRGRAFCALIEHLPTDGLPDSGGTPVGVGVTIDWKQLREGVGAAHLDDGTLLSAGQTRRLACQHGLYPLVLGDRSVPLDLGRTRRLFSGGQVKAKRVVQRTCRARGCGVRSTWCEAHHRQPWAQGGRTDLAHLDFLCPHHHQLFHDAAYEHRWHPNGTVTFHRRT